MSKTQSILRLHNKIIYVVNAVGGWSIVIMPDEVVLDNYHEKGGYIHPNPENHKEEKEINHITHEEPLDIVISHIKRNRSLILKDLIKELGGRE